MANFKKVETPKSLRKKADKQAFEQLNHGTKANTFLVSLNNEKNVAKDEAGKVVRYYPTVQKDQSFASDKVIEVGGTDRSPYLNVNTFKGTDGSAKVSFGVGMSPAQIDRVYGDESKVLTDEHGNKWARVMADVKFAKTKSGQNNNGLLIPKEDSDKVTFQVLDAPTLEDLERQKEVTQKSRERDNKAAEMAKTAEVEKQSEVEVETEAEMDEPAF